MTFEEYIRSKYDKEVTESFTEDKWQAFLVHREKQKRRPFGLIFLFGLSMSMLLVGIGWLSDVKPMLKTSMTSISSIPLVEASDLASKSSQLTQTGSPVIKEAATDNAGHTPHLVGIEYHAEKKDVVSKTHDNMPEYLVKKAELPHPMINIPAPGASNAAILHLSSELDSALKRTDSHDIQNGHSHENTAVIPTSLQTKDFSTQSLRKVPITAKSIEIPMDQSTPWVPHQFSLSAYGGLALAFQVGTVDEQMHQIGLQLRFNISNRWRTKFGFEYSAVDFVATEMNPKIGVDYVESPSELLIFSEAIVESAGINLDLGVDYLIWRSKRLNIYAGASYRLSKEIKKGIDYEFVRDDDNNSVDDIFISSTKSSRYFEPLNVNLTLGAAFYVNNSGFSVAIARPVQLSRSKVNLLDQLQINFGLIRKF